jgi:hypothetical protein
LLPRWRTGGDYSAHAFWPRRWLRIAVLQTDSANTSENHAKPQHALCARYKRV